MIKKIVACILLSILSFSSMAIMHKDIQPVEKKSVMILNRILYPIVYIIVFGPDKSSMYLPGTRVILLNDSVTFRINTFKGCQYTFLIFSSTGYWNQIQLDVCWHNEGSFITLEPGDENESEE